MAAEEKPKLKGGRYGLPGIPSYIDRVSQETIYSQKIISENQYFEKCKTIPEGSHIERMGILKGFEIVKFPSYVEVRKVYEPKDMDEKPAFIIGQGTKYAGSEMGSSPRRTGPKKSTAEKILEAQAECNRTAPTYAYKYFSEKHMGRIRGGPMENKKQPTMADIKARHEAWERERLEAAEGTNAKKLRSVKSEPKFKNASVPLAQRVVLNAGTQTPTHHNKEEGG